MAFLIRPTTTDATVTTFDFSVSGLQLDFSGFFAPQPSAITGTLAFDVSGLTLAFDGTFAGAATAPTPHDFTATQVGSVSTSHVVTLPTPADVPFGAAVIIAGGFDGIATVSTPSGWSIMLGVPGTFGGTHRQNGFYRIADTNWPLAGDTTVTVTVASPGQRGAWGSWWVDAHAISTTGLIAGSAGSSVANTTPDPPNQATVGGTSQSLLALEINGVGGQDTLAGYASADYTNWGQVISGAGSPGCGLQVAYRQLTASAVDPGAMALNSAQHWRATTVLVPFGTEGVESPPGGGGADLVIGPGQNIQTALDSLASGELLGLNAGTYYESFTLTGGRRIRAEVGGTVTFDAGNATLNAGAWGGSGSTWTRTITNPNLVVMGRTILIEISTTGLSRGYSYSGGVVTLRTGGVDPNGQQVTVSERDYCISVDPGAWDHNSLTEPAVSGIKFRGFRRIAIRRSGASPGSSSTPAAPTNFLVQDCDFVGSWKGVDWGRETGGGNIIRWCSFSNYPVFRDSTRNAADSGSPSENTQWGTLYSNDFIAGGLASGDRNMASARFGGAGDKFHNNITFNLFDSVQPRQGSSSVSMTQQEIYYNALIHGRDDIEYDSFSTTLLHNFRHHHNFHLCCYVYCALSVVARGPGHVDRNIFLEVPEAWADGLARGTFFKFRNDQTGVNNFIFHNTVRGAPKPSHGLYFQGAGAFTNCHDINNIYSFSDGSGASLPGTWTHTSNLTGASPGFTATAPYNFTPTVGSSAASGGNTTLAPSQFTGTLQSHRGALAVGEVWPLRANTGTDDGHTGPRWAVKIMADLMTEMLIDGLPTEVDPLDLGITV